MMIDFVFCGLVCLLFCQDIQVEVYDYFEVFFELKVWCICCLELDQFELNNVVELIKVVKVLVIVIGGGIIYFGVEVVLGVFVIKFNILIVEIQVGKFVLLQLYLMNYGVLGVDGLGVVNDILCNVDLVIGVGMCFQDFIIGLWLLFENLDCKLVLINVVVYDVLKYGVILMVLDVKVVLEKLFVFLGDYQVINVDLVLCQVWLDVVNNYCVDCQGGVGYLLMDCEVIGVVQCMLIDVIIVMCVVGIMFGVFKLLW